MENRSFQRAGCPVEPFRSFLFSFTVRGILRLNNGISLGCQKRCITIRSRFQVERCLRAGRWWLKSMSASLLSVNVDGKSLASFAQWRYSNQWSNREVLLLLVENYTQYPAISTWNIVVLGNFCRLLWEQIFHRVWNPFQILRNGPKSPGLSIFHRVETCRLSGENVSTGHQPTITGGLTS